MMSAFFTILQRHGASIADVFPVDQDGFRLQPKGIQPEELREELKPTLVAINWITTAIIRGAVLVEPYYTNRISYKNSEVFYHVSDSSNRPSILELGLEIRGGGNTSMQRYYPDRIHVALNLPAAIEFLDFQCRQRIHPFTREPTNTPKVREEQDVWKVRIPEGCEMFRDIQFPGKAGWIEHPIPAANVALYENWQDAYQQWQEHRMNGFF